MVLTMSPVPIPYPFIRFALEDANLLEALGQQEHPGLLPVVEDIFWLPYTQVKRGHVVGAYMGEIIWKC